MNSGTAISIWVSFFIGCIPVFLGIVACIFGYGKFKATAVTKDDCGEFRGNCPAINSINNKLDGLTDSVNKHNDNLVDVQKTLSKVEGYLEGIREKPE